MKVVWLAYYAGPGGAAGRTIAAEIPLTGIDDEAAVQGVYDGFARAIAGVAVPPDGRYALLMLEPGQRPSVLYPHLVEPEPTHPALEAKAAASRWR